MAHVARLYLPSVNKHLVKLPYDKNLAFGIDITRADNPEQFHHICNVLRLQIGDNFISFNGTENLDFGFVVTDISKKSLRAKLCFVNDKTLKSQTSQGLNTKLTLLLCLLKKEQLSDAIRMATEVGADKIIFVTSQNSKQNVKFFNYNRAMDVVVAAACQCQISKLPILINKPISIECLLLDDTNINTHLPFNIICANEALSALNTQGSDAGTDFMLDTLKTYINKAANDGRNEIGILIGPEGGFGKDDMLAISQSTKNILQLSLGNNILRASTASTSLLFLLKFLLQNT